MKYLLIILFGCGALISCKKDKLEDDKAIFIGKWEWIRTNHGYDWCHGDATSEILTPDNQNINYSIEFKKDGTVIFYENEKRVQSKRLVFKLFEMYDTSGGITTFRFIARLNDNDGAKNSLSGFVSEDSLINGHLFPFAIENEGCEGYTNYFVKQ